MSSITGVSSTYDAQKTAPKRRDDTDMHARMDKTMSSVAGLLGVNTDDLESARRAGTSLASLASQQGVSQDDLQATLTAALKANAPADAPADMDFAQMASDMISGKGGPGGHAPQGMHARLSATGQNASTSDLPSILSSMGVDSTSLLAMLQGTSTASTSASSTSDDTASDASAFMSQLQNLLKQYSGTKGNLYDTAL